MNECLLPRLLVEWNKVLFDTYIPEAWAELLVHMSRLLLDEPLNIYRAWPPQSLNTPGGDPAYWSPLGGSLLRIVANKQLKVWPLIQGPNLASFSPIQDCLVARNLDSKYLLALAAAGVSITEPPPYILSMISQYCGSYKELSPRNVRTCLLVSLVIILATRALG